MTKKIVTLSGDGIGPEIINAGLQVLSAVAEKIGFDYELDAKDFGGAAIDKFGVPLPDETLEAARNADAILHAAIGDPKFDGAEIRPEQGLLKIRKELGLFANVRPLKIYEPLKHLSPIKNVENVDFVTIRELTGGVYFGEHTLEADKRGTSTITHVSRLSVWFDLLLKRRKNAHVSRLRAWINKMSLPPQNFGARR